MSTKRQPSKQRRQTQNQRQRAALEARRANAAAAGAVPEGKVGGGSARGRAAGGGGSAALPAPGLGRPPGGPSAPARRPAASPSGTGPPSPALLAGVAGGRRGRAADLGPGRRRRRARRRPRARWSASGRSARATPSQDDPDATADELVDAVDDWTPNGEEPYGKANFPLSLALLLPVVGAGLAFRAVSKRAPAKVVNRTMYVTLFGTLLSGQLPHLPPDGRRRRHRRLPGAQGRGAGRRGGRRDEATSPADDGVIDVDEVDRGRGGRSTIEATSSAEDDEFLDADGRRADDAERRTTQRSV